MNNLPDFRPASGGQQQLFVTVEAGEALIGTTPTSVLRAIITCAASTTTYIFLDLVGGTIGSNTSGFLATHYPIAIAITDANHVSTLTDVRPGAWAPSVAVSYLGQVTKYNSQATAGQGLAAILAQPNTTPTTPVTSTKLLALAPAGLYRVTYYSVVTTTGTVGTSFSLKFIFTDADQAQTIAAFTNSTFTAGDVNQGSFIVQNQAAADIDYSITEAGSFTVHPVLALSLAIERIA